MVGNADREGSYNSAGIMIAEWEAVFGDAEAVTNI
jgi:hypothetical protein